MSHDYEPNWDYPCIDLADVADLSASERAIVTGIVERVRRDLAPSLGFDQGFEVFYAETLGMSGDGHGVFGIYCNGTNSRPVVGFELSLLKYECESRGLDFSHQFEVTLAHELAHAYQESCGLNHEHEGGFDEDGAEAFAVRWTDAGVIELWRLNPALVQPSEGLATCGRRAP